MQQPALLVLVKNPIAGKTKTRLAQDVGPAKALQMYGILLRHTRDQALGLRDVTRYLHYSEHVAEDDWSGQDFIKLVQRGTDLGQRMELAFDHAFARDHDRVVLIGSDCPGVTTELLEEAFEALRTHEVVLGPANDGGYYLIGLRNPQPGLFRDMTWSTSSVFEETWARAQVKGLSLYRLPNRSDVDHLEDWLSYGWQIPADEDR